MTTERAIEILGKQLELLAEKANENTTTDELYWLTRAMVDVSDQINHSTIGY